MFWKNLLKKKNIFEPTLTIMPKPYAVMFYATQAAPGEVSGLGKVEKGKDGNFTLTESIILEQTCSNTGTTLDEEALNDFLFKLAKQKKNPSEYNCWWHTHADFDVFWSGIDEDNVKSLVIDRYLISIVLNKKGSILVRYDSKDVSLREIPYCISPTNEENIKENTYKEVKTKVKKAKIETIYTTQMPVYTKGGYGYFDRCGGFTYPSYSSSFSSSHNDEKEDMKCTKCGWKGKQDFAAYTCPICGHNTLDFVINPFKEAD